MARLWKGRYGDGRRGANEGRPAPRPGCLRRVPVRTPSRSVLVLALSLTAAASVAWAGAPATAVAGQELSESVRPLLEKADRQRQNGRLDEAMAGYRRVLELDPDVVAAYVALGALHHRRGETEAALEVFRSGLEHAPNHPDLLYNAAVLSLRLERYDPALAYCDGALAVSPDDPLLHSLRGRILDRLGRSEEALAELEKAVELAPGDAQAHFRLGNLYHELGRGEAAIASYQRAIKREKDLLSAHYNLGAVLYEEERYDEALRAYQIALKPIDQAFARGEEVDAIHARAYANLGAIYYRREEASRAVAAYEKSLRLDREQPVVLYNLGFLHYQSGDFEPSFEYYQSALTLDPELPLAYLHLGEIERRRNRHEAAVVWLTRGRSRLEGEDRVKALSWLADSYAVLGDFEKAASVYREVLAVRPDSKDALVGLGSHLRRQGRGEEALALLEKALLVDPRDSAVALELATLLRGRGEREREKALYRGVLEREGERWESWPLRLRLAQLHLEEGDLAAARRELEPVVGRLSRPRPGSGTEAGVAAVPEAALLTAYALMRALEGASEDARGYLQAALRRDSTFPAAVEATAVLDALNGELEGAARALMEVLSRREGEAASRLRGNLGQVLWLAGRSDEARRELETASRALPRWLSPRLALGEMALADGDYPRALDLFGEVRETCRGESRNGSAAGAEAQEAAPEGERLEVFLGASRDRLCGRAEEGLGLSLVGSALASLEGVVTSGAPANSARNRAERALSLPLSPPHRALALFVRATAHLVEGADGAAADDLEEALRLGLPETVRSQAYNNLGVAQHRLDRREEARQSFEAAQAAAGAAPAALLNLGIALDEARQHQAALGYYERYVAAGGRRRQEAQEWIERLRSVSP